MKTKLTSVRLRELLHYDPESGDFTWRVDRTGKAVAGSVAGWKNTDGYLVISIDNRSHKAHRLAWFWMHERWPYKVDHKNQIKDDNRFCNLREVNDSESCQNRPLFRNNTSGFRGVTWNKTTGRWLAHIRHLGKRRNLGYFTTAEDAYEAYKQAAAQLHTHNPEASQWTAQAEK